jgi:hypothetical protein
MKSTIIIVCILLILVTAQFMIARSTDKTEQQKYTVLLSEQDFEIRYYPVVVVASVEHDGKKPRSGASDNFRRLAGYIFGGNQSNKKIAMTAPVHMESTDHGNKMSFVMPSEMDLNDLPKPNDSGVTFSKTTEDTLAVLRFSGFASDADIEQKTEELKQRLADKGISHAGNFKYLGYNPPYQLVDRRNEVVVSVHWKN